MKLSIIIPAYNEENYIGECLESIQSEMEGKTYAVETIVVDNASTDKTAETARAFPGVKVVYEPAKGLTSARRAGYLASVGDLVANIDADTKLPAGWIDKVFSEFSHNGKLVALSGPYIYYDLSYLQRGAVKFFYFLGYLTHIINHKILKKGAMLQGGNFIIRRSALERIHGYNTKIDFYGEDTDVARRIQKVGEVKFTFDLPMYTSGRRLRAEGILTMAVRYLINYFWVLVFKKPFTKKYKDIRNA
ncbi:MAG: glycosyltransferase family 2 protein [Parcubacteria group bacterium]